MTWVLTILPLGLLLAGFPLFIILLGASAVALAGFMNLPATAIPQILFSSIDKFSLLSVPFFIFAGEVMSAGGMSKRIVDWVLSLFGGVRASRGLTTVGACTVFGAMSGSSVATVAAVGRLMYPSLQPRYGTSFSSGLIAGTGAIDVLIPPSIVMILYGAAAEQSVAMLFIAGILPGLLMAAVQGAYVYGYAVRHGIDDGGTHFDWKLFARTTRTGFWSLCAPAVVLGGIYGGIFSPTEAAGIACVYGIIIAKFVYREVSWRQLWEVGVNSMYLTAQIMVVVCAAGVFSWILTVIGAPQALAAFARALIDSPWMALAVINIVLLVVGCFIDPTSAVLVLTPLLVPICKAYGIDLVHFGIIMTMNLAIGMFTPPFGLNIFVTQVLTQAPVRDIYRGLVPFILITILALVVVTYVPWLSLVLTKFA